MVKRLFLLVAALAAAGYLAWALSPWPSALFYRALMDKGGIALNEALAKHVPAGVSAQRGLSYDAADPNALLDIFRPSADQRAVPVIVWVHGGAFLSGNKDQVANYLQILAGKGGYVTVGIDYSLAPRAQYPAPVRQTVAALRYVLDNAVRFGIDPSRIVLAGDSAGAQIAAQVVALISSSDYAARLAIPPPIAREQLRGAVLFCGFHDPDAMTTRGSFGGFLRTATWSYFGVKDFSGDARAGEFSIVKNVTPTFPPLFISAGNADPLLAHSEKLSAAAAAKGIIVDSLFFPDDYAPGLPHEYQFNLDNDAGQQALERTLKFLAQHLKQHGGVDAAFSDYSAASSIRTGS